MPISIHNAHTRLFAFLLLGIFANIATAEEPLTFAYCVSTPLPVVDLTVSDGARESLTI